jgi:hypothetical protein
MPKLPLVQIACKIFQDFIEQLLPYGLVKQNNFHACQYVG